MKYRQYLSEYEVQTGKKASEYMARFAAAMDEAMERFERMGQEHAGSNRKPYTKEAVMRWALHEAGADLAELIGAEMYDSYMRGYGREAAA